jgi:hypothetical protein
MKNTADVTGGKPIAVWLQSISRQSAVNLLIAFYDIHGREGEELFCSALDTRQGQKPHLIDTKIIIRYVDTLILGIDGD